MLAREREIKREREQKHFLLNNFVTCHLVKDFFLFFFLSKILTRGDICKMLTKSKSCEATSKKSLNLINDRKNEEGKNDCY